LATAAAAAAAGDARCACHRLLMLMLIHPVAAAAGCQRHLLVQHSSTSTLGQQSLHGLQTNHKAHRLRAPATHVEKLPVHQTVKQRYPAAWPEMTWCWPCTMSKRQLLLRQLAHPPCTPHPLMPVHGIAVCLHTALPLHA
jgi:hypothetical protein